MSSQIPPPPPSSPSNLTEHQKKLVDEYKQHYEQVASLMNKVVKLDSALKACRDDPDIQEGKDEMSMVQGLLVNERVLLHAKKRKIEEEEERLRNLDTVEASVQLTEIREGMRGKDMDLRR